MHFRFGCRPGFIKVIHENPLQTMSQKISASYTSFRDELVGLLQEAEAMSECHKGLFGETENDKKSATDQIAEVRRKLKSDQFSIVLCGAFGSGKSTTFDALCGGRELSPVGFGIRTSGCVVRAVNLPDPEGEEHAVIYFKEDRDLVMGFANLLGSALTDLALDAGLDLGQAMRLEDWFRLDDPVHLGLLREAIKAEYAKYENDRRHYPPEDQDILRVAKLVADHVGDSGMSRMRASGLMKTSLDDARKFMAFPQDWDDRWQNGAKAVFDLEAIKFLFVSQVDLYVRSADLERLGCVVVDAPGLFASRWDTLIAFSAFTSADAIFFLFDGSRTITESDLTVLKEILKTECQAKLFIGCNMKGQEPEHTERLLSTSRSKLANTGIMIEDDAVAIYHARMALKAQQLLAEVNGSPSSDGGHVGNSKTLVKTLNQDLYSFPDLEICVQPDSDSANACYQASRLPLLVDTMERFILRRKARFALIDYGSKPLFHAVNRVEGGLMIVEESADKKVELEKAQFEQADQALKEFEEKVTEELNMLEPGSRKRKKELDDPLLSSFQLMLIRCFKKEEVFLVDGIASKLAKCVVGKSHKLRNAKVIFKKEDERNKWIQTNVLVPALKEVLTPVYDALFEGYYASLMKDDSPDAKKLSLYVNNIQKSIESNFDSIRDKLGSDSVISKIVFETIPERLFLDFGNRKLMLDSTSPKVYSIIKRNDRNLFVCFMLGSIVGGLLLSVLSSFLFPVYIGIGMKIIDKHAEKTILEALRKDWDKIETQIYASVRSGFNDGFILPLLDGIRKEVENRANGPRREFENRKREAEKRWVMAEEDRRKLAEQARDIRTRDVAPLREKIGDFIARAGVEYPAVS